MANYNQVSYGSSGSDVKTLQELLNKSGNYNLDEDGNFGSKTLAAVKDYQKNNNLSVDGIVGKNTWGALTKAQNDTAATTMPSVQTGYQASDAVKQAEAMLQQQMANKPGAYQSSWQNQLDDTIQKILNREQFSYDMNGDALYQQYKDQYTTQGKLAMMDTMGQVAAMTGGYGNSYAQSVGQQAYQGYLQELNDRVPELYQLAMSKYQMEGDALYKQAALMAQQEDQEYGRYRDQISDYYAELDRLQSQYDTERDYDYGKYIDDRNFSYQQEQDRIAQKQWQAEFDETKRQFDKQYALNASKSYGSSGTGNNLSGSQVLSLQKDLGVPQTGVWDSATAAAAQTKYGTSSANSAYSAWSALTNHEASYVNSFDAAQTIFQETNAPYSVYAYLLNENDWAKSSEYNRSRGGRFGSYQEYLKNYMEWFTSGSYSEGGGF